MTTKLQNSSRKIVMVSFLVDVLDVVTNLVVAVITGSATIFSEMAQGIADSIGSVFLVIGERRSRRPADNKHPLGYGREAFFWSLLSSIIMLIVGAGLSFWRGFNQLFYPEPLESPFLAIAVIVLAIITNGYAVSLSAKKLKQELGNLKDIFVHYSHPLVKGAFIRDVVGTSTSILGLIALLMYQMFTMTVFDAIGALLSGLMMLLGSMVLIVQARALITGQTLPTGVLAKITDALMTEKDVEKVNHLAAVYSGSKEILLEADLDLEDHLKTNEIEILLHSLEDRVRKEVPGLQRISFLLNSPDQKKS